MSWEEAVLWLRSQADRREFVEACFFDDPLLTAAERYRASTEWAAVRALIASPPGNALDIGSGRGISAFALAKDGWATTALEPNPSPIVGAAAIRELAQAAGVSIAVVETWGEALPFASAQFDLVHVRQALHHAHDLRQLCREIARVLKPGGTMLATREHVLSRKEDLGRFLDSHPMQSLYGGEHAYVLGEYVESLQSAGIHLTRVMNPLETDINTFPDTRAAIRSAIARKLKMPFDFLIPDAALKWIGGRSNTPGRLYSFLGHRTP